MTRVRTRPPGDSRLRHWRRIRTTRVLARFSSVWNRIGGGRLRPSPVHSSTTAPTSLSTESHRLAEFTDAPTVLSTSTPHASGASPTVTRRSRSKWRRYGQIGCAIVAGIGVIVGIGALAALWFWPHGQTLTVTPPLGGTITGNGIACGTGRADCTATIAKGTTVELRAEPDAGFLFGGFTGDCVQGGRTTMSVARTCGATFSKVARRSKRGDARADGRQA